MNKLLIYCVLAADCVMMAAELIAVCALPEHLISHSLNGASLKLERVQSVRWHDAICVEMRTTYVRKRGMETLSKVSDRASDHPTLHSKKRHSRVFRC